MDSSLLGDFTQYTPVFRIWLLTSFPIAKTESNCVFLIIPKTYCFHCRDLSIHIYENHSSLTSVGAGLSKEAGVDRGSGGPLPSSSLHRGKLHLACGGLVTGHRVG